MLMNRAHRIQHSKLTIWVMKVKAECELRRNFEAKRVDFG